MGGAIPEKVILSCVTKLQEGECARDQAMVSSIPPWSWCQLHALTSLSDRMWPQSVSHINPLLLKLFPFSFFFLSQQQKKTRISLKRWTLKASPGSE